MEERGGAWGGETERAGRKESEGAGSRGFGERGFGVRRPSKLRRVCGTAVSPWYTALYGFILMHFW